MTRYGYIGLGMMGSAMAENLIGSGAEVMVYDLDATAVETAIDQGARGAGSPAEVAAASQVISICVPAAEHIEAVLSGPGGIGEGVHDGLSIVVHSTVHPDSVRAAQATAAEWGVPLFDACVAGGDVQARAGAQTVLAGGLADMDSTVTDLLDIYAKTIIDAGPVGAGAALKIAVNVMSYSQFAAAATSYDLVVGAGGNPEGLYEAWRNVGMFGALTEQFTGLLGLPDELFEGSLADMLVTQVGIARKDLGLALELGDTRPGTRQVVEAVRSAMPEIYNVASRLED